MAVIKSEFFLALNQVATERGISPDDVIDSIKAAVLAAYKKDFHDESSEDSEEEDKKFEVKIDKNTGETHILREKKDITPPGFGRIAAQTARQVILQKIREVEKRTIVKQYEGQIGTILKGRVIRFDGKNVHLDIGKTEGFLPMGEQIRGETYRLNDQYTLYLKEIVEDQFGNSRIVVSRAHPKLVEGLFKKEVPEIVSGTVKVHNVVREPGERAKIAVYSDQTGVDPVGACVGQKGIRVKAVTNELGGDEKIDIIQYNEDDAIFIREAMSPAQISNVEIDRDSKHANVYVDEDQAPLAIGRAGANVNLASKLTGYEIDVIQTEVDKKEKSAKPDKSKKSKKTEESETSVKPKDKKSSQKQSSNGKSDDVQEEESKKEDLEVKAKGKKANSEKEENAKKKDGNDTSDDGR
ncbi:MAG: transcription termination factor NusA [Candidatus Paceibacterota bacterium]